MKKKNIDITIDIYNENELNETERTLVHHAIAATHNSYSPYSHFSVGACVLLDDDTIVIGATQDNAAYPVGLCAERSAIFAAQSQ